MRISVIIPTLNEEALPGVLTHLRLTVKPETIECVAADGGSADRTV